MLKRLLGFGAMAAILAAGLVFSQRGKEPLKVSGLIEADEIRVGSRVGGRVLRVKAVEGLTVHVGDVLVELEPFDLLERRAEAARQADARRADWERLSSGFRSEEIAQAKARFDQLSAVVERLVHGPRKQEIAAAQSRVELAQAELQLAQLKFDRTKTLLDRGASNREDMDRATSELRVAKSTLQVRQEEIGQLREGTRPEEIQEAKAKQEEARQAWQLQVKGYRKEEAEQARAAYEAAQATLRVIGKQIEELTIRAPVEGVIEAVELHPGDLVAANAPVISLMDTRSLWVRAYVPENRVKNQIGQKVAVTVDSFPKRRFEAHVSYIARQAEFTPGNVQTPEERSKQVFRIKVVLDEGLDVLRPGMSADVWLDAVP